MKCLRRECKGILYYNIYFTDLDPTTPNIDTDAHPELKLCQNMSSSIDNNSQDDEEKKSPNSFEKKEGEEVHCIYVYV